MYIEELRKYIYNFFFIEMTEEVGNWEELVYDSDYEIYSEYPYPVRRKGKDKIVKECIDGGYYKLNINGKLLLKHRLIGFQWIENEDPQTKTQIDHTDRNKLNNHAENLRWTSPSENLKNKDKVVRRRNEYLDQLPQNAIQVRDFEDIRLDRYYYDVDNERLLLETRARNVRYKIIYPYLLNNILAITLIDENGQRHNRSYTRIINHLNELL